MPKNIGPFSWARRYGSKLRLESNSAGYTIKDKDGLVVETFGPTEFGEALRRWHILSEQDVMV